MNANRRSAAVKKYGTQFKEVGAIATTEQMLKDEYTTDEVEEILQALSSVDSDGPAPKEVKGARPNSPNEKLDLSGFDYKNLTGKSFKKYVALVGDRSVIEVDEDSGEERPVVGELLQNDEYDFGLHKVEVIRKPRFAGVKDSPVDFIGLKVKNETPEHTTRIPVRHALEHNAQIMNAHSIAGHGKYYFLKK